MPWYVPGDLHALGEHGAEVRPLPCLSLLRGHHFCVVLWAGALSQSDCAYWEVNVAQRFFLTCCGQVDWVFREGLDCGVKLNVSEKFSLFATNSYSVELQCLQPAR